jgi:metal-responsive CopG/Arc/MetJ family transcriptional regulator
MSRITVTFTISLPPTMAAELEAAQTAERRSRSEIIREALRSYFAKASGKV